MSLSVLFLSLSNFFEVGLSLVRKTLIPWIHPSDACSQKKSHLIAHSFLFFKNALRVVLKFPQMTGWVKPRASPPLYL